MTPVKRALLLSVFMSFFGWLVASAHAETKLSDFDGRWSGRGTDRNTPLESEQQTSCRADISANLRRMTANIRCDGAAGLTKAIQLRIALSGSEFAGALTQTATIHGSNAAPVTMTGAVSGHKTDTTAKFTVDFPSLTPSVAVTLQLNSKSSFTMHATTFAGALMNVVFRRKP